MLEVMKFIFSDFWIWLGTTIMLYVTFGGLGGLFISSSSSDKKKSK